MDGPGRNELCPCGSGRKFKRCCLEKQRADDVPPPRPQHASRHHQLDERMMEKLFAWSRRGLGSGFDPVADYAFEPTDADVPLFAIWCMHIYTPWNDGKTVAARFLEAHPALPVDERAWLEAQAQSWLGLWEVERVEADKGVHVVDTLSLERRFVHEVLASRTLQPGLHVLARVVDFEGSSVFVGMHPRSLTPTQALDVLGEARTSWAATLRYPKRKTLTLAQLRRQEVAGELLGLWNAVIDYVDHRPLPELHNTDGEPILLTRDHFAVVGRDRAALLQALARIDGLEPTGTEGKEATFVVLRKGNALQPSWDNTAIGHLRLGATKLAVETNSLARADALRGTVEAALAGLVAHKLREHMDPTSLLDKPEEQASTGSPLDPQPAPTDAMPPEVLEALRAMKAQHYGTWPDLAVPALGNKTPRAAMRSAKGRALVQALVSEMERAEARLPQAERADFGQLRRTLGLV